MSKPIETPVPSDLHPYLNEIAERLFSGHAVVMVGSGFSRNAKPHGHPDPNFPDWPQLGDRFYEKLYRKRPDADNRYLSVPTLANEVEAAMGRPVLDQILREAIPDQDSEPSALHVKLLDLPWSDIFTTNYDTLLERARESITSRKYNVVVTQDDLVYSEKPRIVKLHGSLSSRQSLVVTDEDYRRYPDDFALFVNTVRQAFLENILCMIGFSGNDPNFLQWIGWIHDNLGRQNAPRMYLIGMLQLSDSEMRLLEQRNIVTLDLSGYCDIETDGHYEALERFLEYLHSRKPEYSGWDWPIDPLGKKQSIADLVTVWREQRRSFPGWVIVPEDRRRHLWSTLDKSWIHTPPAPNSLPQFLDLEFAFELVWYMEKCLCPIDDRQIDFIEKTIFQYQQFMDPDTSPETLSVVQEDLVARQITQSDIRYMCHHLLLATMRYYREEGLKEQWHRIYGQISRCMATMASEHKAHFYYERTLAALFNLDLPAIKKSLQEWPIDDSLPFWAAKKAGLLAEIGQINTAKRILESSLQTIRSKSDLTPIITDFSAGSQEAIVMFLLQATQQIFEYQKPIKEFNERWHILRQYKCDPRDDLQKFELALEQPSMNRFDISITNMPTFDIGRRAREFHFQNQNKELLMSYNFLRFCEDTGIPFRISGTSIAATSVGGALSRIAAYSSHWAMTSLVRIGDKKDIDRIFARASLARMDADTVDNLVAHYLKALDLAVTDIGLGNRIRNANFGTLLAGVVPEILSRLCCKCSTDTKERLIEFLFQVYQSDAKANYSGIQNLTARLLEACPMHQRYDLIPKLLDFPILSNLEGIEQNEYQNPFRLLKFTRDWIFAQPALSTDNKLDLILKNASSHNANTRKWALITLYKLHQWKLLNAEYTDQFAHVLWGQLDDEGLPSNTDFHRFAFLKLPHPKKFDPVELFKKYVRHAQFPSLTDFSTTRFAQEWTIWDEIQASYPLEWSDNDMHYIVKRLVEWWDINQKLQNTDGRR